MEQVERNDVDIGEREGPGDLHLLLASRNLALQPFCLRLRNRRLLTICGVHFHQITADACLDTPHSPF